MSSLRELLDKLLPADTPAEEKAKAMEYGRKNPDVSDAEIAKMFAGSDDGGEIAVKPRK